MGWHYKTPDTFPAYFSRTLENAANHLGVPIGLGSFSSQSDAETTAEHFRYYKYCIRQTPSHPLQSILENFNVRTSISDDGVSVILWLTVKPTKVSDFVTLNPDLAKEIFSNTPM